MARTTWRADMAEGIRWLADHPPMRTLFITIVAFNVTFGAAWAVLVLYAQERLQMSDVGFGLLTTAMAIGGIIGTTMYGRLERRFSLADIMRVGLLIETGTHLVLALTTVPAVALADVRRVRRARVRVGHDVDRRSASAPSPTSSWAGSPASTTWGSWRASWSGTPIGGWLAQQYGITAPFWFGFVGSAILVTVLWRQFDNIVHAGDHVPHRVVAGADS